MKYAMIAATCGFALTTMTYGQAEPAVGTDIKITGSSAFRAAVDATILAIMSGDRTAYTTGTGVTGTVDATRAIYKGTINGNQYTIRTSWTGSSAGVQALADQTGVTFMVTGSTTATTPVASASPTTESVAATFAFSDVAQAAAGRPNATFSPANAQVGIVPFVFVAGKGTPASVTNITDQQFAWMWSNGGAAASFLTGDFDNDNGHYLYPTGRANTSGTRITVLSETRYGRGTAVAQQQSASTATDLTGAPSAFATTAGYSALDIAALLGKTPNASEGDYSFVSYLGLSDANLAISNGAAAILKYNGVEYTQENVRNGSYTLWGYQQMYRKTGLSALEVAFDTALRAAIDDNLSSDFVGLGSMNVNRQGGDGGAVVEN